MTRLGAFDGWTRIRQLQILQMTDALLRALETRYRLSVYLEDHNIDPAVLIQEIAVMRDAVHSAIDALEDGAWPLIFRRNVLRAYREAVVRHSFLDLHDRKGNERLANLSRAAGIVSNMDI